MIAARLIRAKVAAVNLMLRSGSFNACIANNAIVHVPAQSSTPGSCTGPAVVTGVPAHGRERLDCSLMVTFSLLRADQVLRIQGRRGPGPARSDPAAYACKNVRLVVSVPVAAPGAPYRRTTEQPARSWAPALGSIAGGIPGTTVPPWTACWSMTQTSCARPGAGRAVTSPSEQWRAPASCCCRSGGQGQRGTGMLCLSRPRMPARHCSARRPAPPPHPVTPSPCCQVLNTTIVAGRDTFHDLVMRRPPGVGLLTYANHTRCGAAAVLPPPPPFPSTTPHTHPACPLPPFPSLSGRPETAAEQHV